jgi:hypothetical protein
LAAASRYFPAGCEKEKAMKVLPNVKPKDWTLEVPEEIPLEVTESDEKIFRQITSTQLDAAQRERITSPEKRFPRQKMVLAIHWHPEFIPIPLITQRIEAMFPGKTTELIIPTQHNVLTTYQGFTGVEVDCFARGFNQKVQLLLHFENDRLQQVSANRLKVMLAHTFKYRSSQLFDFIYTLTKPSEKRLNTAAWETGADDALIRFVRIYVKKISELLEKNMDSIPAEMVKNKLLRNFFDRLRPVYGQAVIDRAQTFLKSVKQIVKAHFSLHYFYRASEVIEEARALGAGIVVPHPEQFWPILLADYDVDGFEVWNPQSRRYTEFLIDVIRRKNQQPGLSRRRLLIFMGDDTHMGEKVRDSAIQDPEKANREIGFQPAWEEMDIRKALIRADTSCEAVIEDYRQRLAG